MACYGILNGASELKTAVVEVHQQGRVAERAAELSMASMARILDGFEGIASEWNWALFGRCVEDDSRHRGTGR